MKGWSYSQTWYSADCKKARLLKSPLRIPAMYLYKIGSIKITDTVNISVLDNGDYHVLKPNLISQIERWGFLSQIEISIE
jgi:hypothetical protein